MTRRDPTVSITITSYNYADYIGQLIESALAQTYSDFELVILDDASSDDSVDVIRRYADVDDRIRLDVNEQNQGYAAALDQVVRSARGTFLVHMDSDDWIRAPHALERQVAVLEAHPEVVFVYSTLTELDADGRETMTMVSFDDDRIVPGVVAVDKAMTLHIGHSGPMFRRDAFERIGGYATRFAYVLDLMLWFDLCTQGDVGYIREPLYAYRQHEASMTATVRHRALLTEMLAAIDTVCDGPLRAQMNDPEARRRRAYADALTAMPVALVFADRYVDAWRSLWEGVKLRPREALLGRRTAVLAARTLLRSKGFAALRSLRGDDAA